MSYLDKIRTHKAKDESKTVHLWDVQLHVHPLSFGETMDLSKVLSSNEVSEVNQTVELIAAMVTDPEGNKLFDSDEGKEVLKSKAVADVKTLLDECLSVAKFDTDKAVETATKN